MPEHSITRRRLTLLVLFFVAASGAALHSCDNTINPIDEDVDSGQMSIYGVITEGDNPVYIRVRDMTAPLTGEATRSLDVDVYLDDLDEGTSYELADSVVAFDGVYTHNYRVDQLRKHGHTYRIRAERQDGEGTVKAETQVPGYSEPYSYTPVDRCDVPIQIHFQHLESRTMIDELWIGADTTTSTSDTTGNPELRTETNGSPETDASTIDFAEALDDTVGTPVIGPDTTGGPEFFRVRSDRLRQSEDGDSYYISFSPRNIISEAFQENFSCTELGSDHIYVAYRRLSSEWQQIDIRPIDPLEARHVEGGLGFLGAFYEQEFEIPIDTSELPECTIPGARADRCECPPERFEPELCEPVRHEF